MGSKEEWLSAAMADDTLVVELLLRLKQSQASSSSSAIKSPVLSPRWGLRQRRSRILSPFRFEAGSLKNKESSSTRCSPTTPLSWTGDSSADGFEHSSYPSRSKDCDTNEFSYSTAMAKRLKRRKEFSDLRMEEPLILKERIHMKKELESLRATFKEQTTKNEKLKKMKLNLNFDTSSNSVWDELKPEASKQPCRSVDPTTENVPITSLIQTAPRNSTQSEPHKTQEINSVEEGCFFLPDLNMLPAEDCL